MTGWPVSWKWAVACCAGRGVAAGDRAAHQALRAAPPTGCPRRGRRRRPARPGVSTAGYCVRSAHSSPRGPAPATADRQLLAGLGRDVEHRLLDVEHRQHLGDHVGGDGAAAADLQHPGSLRLDHRRSGPGRRARSGSPRRRRCRAAPRRRSCAGRCAAGSGRSRRAGRRARARRAARSQPSTPAAAASPGPARRPPGRARARAADGRTTAASAPAGAACPPRR